MAKKTPRSSTSTTAKTTTTKPVAAEAPKTTGAPLMADEALPAVPVMPVTPAGGRKAPKVSRAQATVEQLQDEYSYVTKDLRRVFILAAAMFLLLIALNLILPYFGI